MKAFSEILHQGPSVTNASKAIILLHGRGGTACNMLSIADQLPLNNFHVAAPQATNNIWYPQSFMSEEKLNEPYLSNSVREVYELIIQIAQHIPKDQIYIAGFSQGACLTLEVTTRYAEKYGGIIAFTGSLIGEITGESKYKGNFEGTKTFISNGDHDPFIPLIRSQQSQKVMERLGARVLLKVYKEKAHAVSKEEIEFVKENIL